MELINVFKKLFSSRKKNVTMSKDEAREQLRTLKEKYANQTIFDKN